MQIKAEEISKIIRDHIGNYAVDVDVAEVGTVISVGDPKKRLGRSSGAGASSCAAARRMRAGSIPASLATCSSSLSDIPPADDASSAARR